MSTEVQSQQQTSTQQPGLTEQIAQGIGLTNLRDMSQGLQFQSAMSRAALGLPFDPGAYKQMSREELGLTPTQFFQTPARRFNILSGAQQRFGIDVENTNAVREAVTNPNNYSGLGGDELLAMQELDQENRARQSFLDKQQGDYNLLAQNPLVQLTQQQISQAQRMLPLQQEAEQAQIRQSLAQSKLGQQYADTIAPLQLQLAGREAQLGLDRFGQLTGPETAGAMQNLSYAQQAQTGAYGAESALRGDLTDLAISGRAASPAQQAIIDKRYRDQLAMVEQDLARQYEDSTRLLPEVATARGIRVNSADLPDRYALARREFLRQGGQAASALGAEAANASLNYPIQLGNLNVQQQYLTGQQQGRVLPAIQSSAALRQGQPQYFPGYQSEGGLFGASSGQNALAPFQLPLNMLSAGQGGVASATSFQNPFLQSRLANTTQTGNTSTGGFIPALGAATGMLQGLGSAAQGAGGAMAGYKGVPPGCWIAMLLYGENAWQTHLLRWYIWGPFSETRFGKAFADMYLKYGERMADWLHGRLWAQAMIRPFFDALLSCALRARMEMVEYV